MSYDLLSMGQGTRDMRQASENARMDAITQNRNNYLQSIYNRGGRMDGPDTPDYLRGQESAILPYYMGDTEKRMGTDLAKAYTDTGDLSYQDFKNAGSRYTTMQRSADDAVGSLYNGGMERQQLSNFAPVADARVKFSRQAAMDGLNKTLAGIEATQATKGYNGDSYTANRMRLDANTGAARQVAGANLQNLTDIQGIKNRQIDMRFQNWNTPNQMADASRQQLIAPTTAFVNSQNARAGLFAPLRVGGQPFQYSPLPSAYTQPFGVGAADELGQIGSSVAKGISANRQANAWQNYQQNYANQSNMRSTNNWQEGGAGGGGSSWPSWGGDYTGGYGSFGSSTPYTDSYGGGAGYGGETGG